MAQKLRVGVVGCGSICIHRHAPEYAAHPDVEIVAFCDPIAERAEKMRSRYGGKAVTDYRDVTRDPSIDALSDCSSNDMHHVVTTDALEHGKHVLCEKPISVSLENARTMVEARDRSGKTLMVAYNQRYAAGHRKAKAILAGGELGRVLTFSTTFGHKGPEFWSQTKGPATWFFEAKRSVLGAAADLGVHKADLIRFLLSDEIAEVASFAGTLDKKGPDGKPIGVCDNMVCVLKMRSGAMGTLAASWTYYGADDNSTVLHCEKGVMEMYGDPVYQLRVSTPGGEQAFYKVDPVQANEKPAGSGVIDAFVSSVMQKTPPPITAEDGIASLRVFLAALESSEKGVTVRL
ncbi:MAG TPA: Gfo/Idh/MocA family oxidoreductase [Spirochaetia bacterium]|nr:Gfo/Idh/MocA family oxidoreductase [Spirochaetia bacterium]